MDFERIREEIRSEFESRGYTCENVRAYPVREVCRNNVTMMKTATAVVNGRMLYASAESVPDLIGNLWANYGTYDRKYVKREELGIDN